VHPPPKLLFSFFSLCQLRFSFFLFFFPFRSWTRILFLFPFMGQPPPLLPSPLNGIFHREEGTDGVPQCASSSFPSYFPALKDPFFLVQAADLPLLFIKREINLPPFRLCPFYEQALLYTPLWKRGLCRSSQMLVPSNCYPLSALTLLSDEEGESQFPRLLGVL